MVIHHLKKEIMLILQNVTYRHPDKELLLEDISLTVNNHDKIALIGNNGSGKSTLLKIIAGQVQITAGQLKTGALPYYIPQVFGQYNHLTIAQALQVADKIRALKEILDGNITEDNLNLLEEDWTIERRCHEALRHWGLKDLELTRGMQTLSGGQKTKVFLAGISIHRPRLVLLDEPGNHLDNAGRELLEDFIRSTRVTLIMVSHDRKLLNLLDRICELNERGITVYGGDYDFYAGQKQMEEDALELDLKSKEKVLRKAREKQRETMERQNRSDARGKRKQETSGLPTISMNTLRNTAERSTARIKSVHTEKIDGISGQLQALRKELPRMAGMKFGFDHSPLHKGKILFAATGINFGYHQQRLWADDLNFKITSGERIALTGLNGSGKTTLIKIILGELQPRTGSVYRAACKPVYIDQDYSLIDNRLNVYRQAQQFNRTALQEHEVKSRLNHFLFAKQDWDKPCKALSGGEKMRLMLCLLAIGNRSPDMIILDEPTNNLDIQNIKILTAAINEYEGTLIVVSHDADFPEQTGVSRRIRL
ncbi:MAG TPA: ABC-F family ATP-binding cassette domain-containing protein [Chitinophagaceae bacterium]|nr:ABC-F family ATP-binding cassette domain-containing protein [Chitinophagaceae bacterium]